MSESKQPEFTIVFVEDNLRAMNSQIDEIANYLNGKGYKLKLLTDEESGKKVNEYLNNDSLDIDIVVTDNSMKNEGDGLKIVEQIREKSELIDILLYSAKGLKIDDFRQASHYTRVIFVDDRKIVDHLESLIDKNLSKWDDVIFLRGIAISRVIDLESDINLFLERYFRLSSSDDTRFRSFVLENRYVSLEAKKKILSKIRDHEKIEFNGLGKLGTLQEERNYLAHCHRHESKNNCLIHMGDDVEFTKDRMREIFSMVGIFSSELRSFEEKITQKNVQASQGEPV